MHSKSREDPTMTSPNSEINPDMYPSNSQSAVDMSPFPAGSARSILGLTGTFGSGFGSGLPARQPDVSPRQQDPLSPRQPDPLSPRQPDPMSPRELDLSSGADRRFVAPSNREYPIVPPTVGVPSTVTSPVSGIPPSLSGNYPGGSGRGNSLGIPPSGGSSSEHSEYSSSDLTMLMQAASAASGVHPSFFTQTAFHNLYQ